MSRYFADVPIQNVRDFWNTRPCNIRHSAAAIGTKEFFDQVEERKYFVEPHIPDFAEFPRWRGKRVLEIGCGIGTDTMNFARAGAEVTAIDLSNQSLDLARKRAEVYGLSNRIKFYEADAERLDEFIPPQKYDLIYSFGVIHHSPNPDRIVRQIRQNFSDRDSTLKLMVYYRYAWKVFSMLLREKAAFLKLDEVIARHSEAQTGCPITYSYSTKKAAELIGEGFEITSMFVDHIFPYRIDKYKNHEYERTWYFRLLPKPAFRAMERRFGWHLCLTAKAK